MNKKIIIIFVIFIDIIITIFVINAYKSNKKSSLNNTKTENSQIFYTSQNKINDQLEKIKLFIKCKNSINNIYKDNILTSSINKDDLVNLEDLFNQLDKTYQDKLNNDMININNQYLAMAEVKQTIKDLFEDDEMKKVINTINREQLNFAQNKLNELVQQDLKEQYQPYLSTVLKEIEEKEEQIRITQEQEQKRLEEERKRQIEEQNKINNSYIEIKNIPYISQNQQQVYNGCEVASILMALKYKGYLTNTTLKQIAEDIPKSNDPHNGFIRDIFAKEPNDVPHWIAPDALTKFAISYSGYYDIFNITGASIEQLKTEIDNGNPVVVYITYRFNQPTNWVEEMPKNLHVVLLTGYNTYTESYVIIDPYTPANGIGRMIINKNTFESIYDKLNRNAIVIR